MIQLHRYIFMEPEVNVYGMRSSYCVLNNIFSGAVWLNKEAFIARTHNITTKTHTNYWRGLVPAVHTNFYFAILVEIAMIWCDLFSYFSCLFPFSCTSQQKIKSYVFTWCGKCVRHFALIDKKVSVTIPSVVPLEQEWTCLIHPFLRLRWNVSE